MIHDRTTCTLGEGPLWHPERGQLVWFDILGKRLHGGPQPIDFQTYASAAGWVSRDELLVATADGLYLVDIEAGRIGDRVVPLEADNPVTRSNDGRADPQGGFWIGTMGISAEPGAGAIWRYYRGELRRLFAPITISNAICFAPEGDIAYFCDTPTQVIQRVRLDRDGWPLGEPEPWLDLSGTDYRPDGAVCDAEGRVWNAQWGAGRVAAYAPDGRFLDAVGFAATQTSCPVFGGPDLDHLFCTSAAEGRDLSLNPHHGRTFVARVGARGQTEHRVIL